MLNPKAYKEILLYKQLHIATARATADFSYSNSFCSSIILSIDENIETISDLSGNMQPYLLPATVTCDSGSNSLSKT